MSAFLDLFDILLVTQTGPLNKLSVHDTTNATLTQIPTVVVILLNLFEMLDQVLVNLLFLAISIKKVVIMNFNNTIKYLPWLHRHNLEIHSINFFALRGDDHVFVRARHRYLIGR